ncbi:MAG: TonB-dependent receptor [Sphingobium sp.]|nr:TonB-dependent receptor [Sphingobium sp.]
MSVRSNLRAQIAASALAIGLATVMSTPAFAQDAAPSASESDQPIVVTGSRIRRPADFDTPSPIVSLSAATVQESGTTNLTDFLSGYPALQGSSIGGDNSGSDAGIGYTGLNLLDLRNLGTQRTLVLVNGRRHVSAVAGDAAVDINTMPSDLIDHIDVLTGGESAIYGADAVTGVVNFVLKDHYNGINLRAQNGISRHGDAGQRLITLTAGTDISGGRGNIAFAYEHGEEDRLEMRQRPSLTGTARTAFYLNPDDPENQGNYTGPSDNGIPDNVPLNNIRYFDTNREGGIDLDWDGFPDYFVGQGGALTAFDPGKFVPDFYQQGGNATLVSDYGNDLLPETKRDIFNFIGHFDVSKGLTLFAEAKFAKTKSFSLAQPSFDYYLVIPEDNPYIPAGVRTLIDPDLGGVLVNRDNFDFGQRGELIDRETTRAVIGARGEIGTHLNYELSYTFGQTKVENTYINNQINDRFYAAIDAVTGPNGQPTCRVNVDPTWVANQPYNYTRSADAPVTFQPGECVPLNLFGEGAPSKAALAWITADTVDRATISQHVVTGSVSGDLGGLFSLPGGPIGFAVGGEYRKERSQFTADPLAAQGFTFTNALSDDGGEYDVKEAFAELNAPLLRNIPFAYNLSVGGAIRFSDYSTIGTTTTWKVDGSYAPVRDITFNGTYSRAVRAPNIAELFAGNSQTFEFITDPCNPNRIQNGTQYRQANCQQLLTSLGANPATYSDGRSTNLPGFQGGNPNLDAEEATTWTAGVILEPRFIPGLSLRADWYDIKIDNAINQASAAQIAELCVDQPTLQNQYCPAIVRQNGAAGTADPGNILGFTVGPFNVANFHTAGLDVTLAYRVKTEKLGTFSLLVRGNYLDRLTFISSPGADVTNRRGEALYRAPKYTINGDLTWKMGKVTLNYGLLWFGKTSRYSNQEMESNTDIVAPEYKYLKQRWQHDLYGAVDVNPAFQFYAGVNNLFDQKPELGTNTYPVNSVGRFYYVGVKAKLDSLF